MHAEITRWFYFYGRRVLAYKSGNSWQPRPFQDQDQVKPKRQNLKTALYLRNYKFDQTEIRGSRWDRKLHFVDGLPLPQSKSNIADGRPPSWKSLWRRNYAANCSINMKVGRPVQNNVLHDNVAKIETGSRLFTVSRRMLLCKCFQQIHETLQNLYCNR